MKSKKVIENSVQVMRALWQTALGQQYGTNRDIYKALGYPISIEYKDYFARYIRQDIATAIIDRPINTTWMGGVSLLESDNADETQLEKEFKLLYNNLSLITKFIRVDRLTGLGKYGILLLGFDDIQNQDEFKTEVNIGKSKKLLFVKPLGEGSAVIKTLVNNVNDQRYGLPEIYDITMQSVGAGTTTTIPVHHSRVLHITEKLLESEYEGTPRLESVYNRLFDLEKLVGGSAEMFWRGARPGFQGKIDQDFNLSTDVKNDLKDQLNEYEHNLRRFLMLQGVDMKPLEQQIADPSSHVDIQISMISAITGIPKKILIGTERGELASKEDKNSWFELIRGRRESFAEPMIIRKFVDRCIETGVLPEPKNRYSVIWKDLWSLSEKEQAETAEIQSRALSVYANSMVQDLIPPDVFNSEVMGWPDEIVELIREARDGAVDEELNNV